MIEILFNFFCARETFQKSQTAKQPRATKKSISVVTSRSWRPGNNRPVFQLIIRQDYNNYNTYTYPFNLMGV